ncbi:22303_t:CDS:2 [Cetraspora pellucida]|uniref:22303_t:CDS:1 n=1 Tax=Cetraspora pellucida TaxID=1433469 RepID=A0A9N8WMI2_9GLOM|nr:22303_t:CDS:2 [Cetraspora pellucida]
MQLLFNASHNQKNYLFCKPIVINPKSASVSYNLTLTALIKITTTDEEAIQNN